MEILVLITYERFWRDHLALSNSHITSVISLISMQLLLICKDLQK